MKVQSSHHTKVTKFSCTENCDALRDLVKFAQFKKRGKHPWRSAIFSKK